MPRPVQVYDFTAFSRRTPREQQPGDRLDAQFRVHADAIAELERAVAGLRAPPAPDLDALAQELRAAAEADLQDLRQQAINAARIAGDAQASLERIEVEAARAKDNADRAEARLRAVELEFQALPRAPVVAPHAATLPIGVLGPNAGGFYAADTLGATATASDYAQVSIDWAEWLPDTIPPNILAINGITGDHWSSRWWANRAATIVATLGVGGNMGGDGVFCEAPSVASDGSSVTLSRTPSGPVLMVVNGMAFLPVGAPPPFVISGRTLLWQSSIYSLVGADVGAWYPYSASMTPLPPMAPGSAVSLYYIATAGQAAFAVTTADYFGASFVKPVGAVRVMRNGSRLMPDTGAGVGGYSFSGSTVTLLHPAGAGEQIAIDVWGTS